MGKLRITLLLVSLLLFPLTLNYMSPVLSLQGAFEGVASGSLLLFSLLFLSSILLGRIWCGWICPGGASQDLASGLNGRKPAKTADYAKYLIWAVWLGLIVLLFARCGGIRRIDVLYMTENVISVDEPFKFIIYYSVVALLIAVAVLLGRRGACHGICWMAPFMACGMSAGWLVKAPSLHIRHKKEACTACGLCKKVCPMSLDPVASAMSRKPELECINCGECVRACRSGALSFQFGVRKQ